MKKTDKEMLNDLRFCSNVVVMDGGVEVRSIVVTSTPSIEVSTINKRRSILIHFACIGVAAP